MKQFYSPETYASVSGYVFENRFYGTVYLKDSVHYLEPHNRKSRDLRIFGNGLKTLIHRLIIFYEYVDRITKNWLIQLKIPNEL